MLKRIVVGVDGRQGGGDALALATVLQRVTGGEIVAVHVYTYDRTVALADAEAVETVLQENLLTTLEDELRAADASARPIVQRDPAPARALHAVAEREDADLIVVGSCHRAGVDRVLAGDDAAQALHGTPCAVAVAPRGYAERRHELSLIGVGYDTSHESHRAFDLACRLAQSAGAHVRATTVVRPAGGRTALHALERAIGDAGDRITPEIMVGKASEMLASSSGDLDLLVVGARAYGPVRRVILGSTSTHLFREASCPVLVLPRGAGAPDGAGSEAVQPAV